MRAVHRWTDEIVEVPSYIQYPLDFIEGYIYDEGIDTIAKATPLGNNKYKVVVYDILED